MEMMAVAVTVTTLTAKTTLKMMQQKKKSWKQVSSPATQKPNNGKQPLQQNCSSWTIPFPLVRRTFLCVRVRVRYCSVLGCSVLTLHFNALSLSLFTLCLASISKPTQNVLWCFTGQHNALQFYSIKFSSSFLFTHTHSGTIVNLLIQWENWKVPHTHTQARSRELF